MLQVKAWRKAVFHSPKNGHLCFGDRCAAEGHRDCRNGPRVGGRECLGQQVEDPDEAARNLAVLALKHSDSMVRTGAGKGR